MPITPLPLALCSWEAGHAQLGALLRRALPTQCAEPSRPPPRPTPLLSPPLPPPALQVPEQGASLQELLGFLLSPEARDLRPLLVTELTNGLDLFLRDRLRRAAAAAATLTPRLPLLGLPLLPGPLPLPPVPVPGRGLLPVGALVDQLAPALSQQEEVYLQVLPWYRLGTALIGTTWLSTALLGSALQC